MQASEHQGWFYGEPERKGRYLIIDQVYWFERIGDWIPGERGKPGHWYIDGRPHGESDSIALFRPLPKLPPRPELGKFPNQKLSDKAYEIG